MIEQRDISVFLREVQTALPDEPSRDDLFRQLSDAWIRFLEQEGEVVVNIAGVRVCSPKLILLDRTLLYLVRAYYHKVLSQGSFLSAIACAISLFLEDQNAYPFPDELLLPNAMIEDIEAWYARWGPVGEEPQAGDWTSLDTYAFPIESLNPVPVVSR